MARDILNERFGKLVAIKKADKTDSHGRSFYECQCDCGNTCIVSRDNLVRNHTKSCGCLRGRHQVLTLEEIQKRFEEENRKNNISILSFNEEENTIIIHCNNCNKDFSVKRVNATIYPQKCPYCDDGFSYPNKFLRNFILQLPVDNYEFEFNPTWGLDKIYDAYFSFQNQKYVVEIDGLQHFKNGFYQTKENQQNNDLLKDQLAEKANYKMIRIDASISSSQYIIEQIKKSLFNELFDLSQINWNNIDINSTKSIVIEIINYLNQNHCSTKELAEHFNISTTTVRKYIKKGKELNLINFDVDKILKEIRNENISKNRSVIHPFKAYYANTGELIGIFNTLNEGQDELRKITGNEKIRKSNIGQVLHGNKQTHYGLTFSYI